MSRAVDLNLGLDLGLLQQGAAFGGRPILEMIADLERVRGGASKAGYPAYDALIDAARAQLTAGQKPSSVLGEINDLIRLFQGQAHGIDFDALSLGIILGWLQQGARANNRPTSLATGDLESARNHAANAQFNYYDDHINAALAKLTSGSPISSIINEVNDLIRLFQAEQ